DLLAKEAPAARVRVLSNIHEVPEVEVPGWEARTGLLFVGSYRHPPNVDAVLWLAREILPLLRDTGIELHLVDAEAPLQVQALGELPRSEERRVGQDSRSRRSR